MASPPRTRRLEAHPFEWGQLTDCQRRAVETLAGLLIDALEGIDRQKDLAADRIDRERRAQLGFIDGDRGTGKTSVQLAIRRLTTAGANVEHVPEVVRRLHNSWGRLVWLETLDMEPLPRTANLLAAILARMGEHLKDPGRRSPSRMSAAFDELDEQERAASDLQELEVDAVLAWQGTHPQRGDRIEPTAYAAEVLSSERAGLKLNPRFDSVLTKLAAMVSTGGADNHMFVLPVDDFDLAPTRCLELLRIIRMVTSPRLFFLIAGSARIAETVLRLQGEGDLSLLSGRHFANEKRAISLCAMEVAANNLRKLIPPQQRVRLEEVQVDEALKFRTSPASKSLEEALDAITFQRNNAPTGAGETTLYSFLRFGDPLPFDLYSAMRWLAGKPRQVLDRTAMFEDHLGPLDNWGRDLLRKLADELSREVKEHGSLEFDQRERLVDFLDTTAAVRFNFSRELKMRWEVEVIRSTEFPGGTAQFRLPFPPRWLFRDKEPQKYDNDAPVPPNESPLPRALGSGITFLHDLAVSLWGGYLFPNSIHYQPEGFFDYVFVDWLANGHEDTIVRWHPPEWWTIREFERFGAHCLRYFSDCRSINDYVRGWLAAELDILLDEPCDAQKGSALERLKRDITRLVEEKPGRYNRKYLRESALVRIALLLAPESGASEKFVRSLLGSENRSPLIKALTGELGDRVRAWRAHTYALAHRSAEVIEPNLMRLLTAISPAEALGEAEARLMSSPYRRDDELVHGLQETIHQQGLRGSGALSALRGYRNSVSAGSFATVVDAAIVALENPFENHPINQANERQLVPTRADIDAINTHVARNFRSPR
jgi:hypothetical protein